MKASFVQALFQGACCICPVGWGSGPFATLATSLAEELAKHGVPPFKTEQRAQQAIKVIGSDNVATALKSKNVWRSLKSLGNNVRFQFSLPYELEMVVHNNKGQPVGKRAHASVKTKPSPPAEIDPSKLALVRGHFPCTWSANFTTLSPADWPCCMWSCLDVR